MPSNAWARRWTACRLTAREAPKFQCQTLPQVVRPRHGRLNCSALLGACLVRRALRPARDTSRSPPDPWEKHPHAGAIGRVGVSEMAQQHLFLCAHIDQVAWNHVEKRDEQDCHI